MNPHLRRSHPVPADQDRMSVSRADVTKEIFSSVQGCRSRLCREFLEHVVRTDADVSGTVGLVRDDNPVDDQVVLYAAPTPSGSEAMASASFFSSATGRIIAELMLLSWAPGAGDSTLTHTDRPIAGLDGPRLQSMLIDE